jgi:hypothetical protein
MNPQAIALALFIIEEAIKEGPGLAADLAALFGKPDPTAEDWAALRARIAGKTYENYVKPE